MWTNDGGAEGFSVVSTWKEDTAPFFTGGWNVQIADLDGDGDVDAIGRTTEGHDGWIENTTASASGQPTAAFHSAPWGNGTRFTVADFDGDGDLEVGDAGPVLFNLDGSVALAVGEDEGSPLYFDIDGDTFVDVVYPDGAMWLNDGTGNMVANGQAPGLAGCSSALSFIFDANLDGDLDVFCYGNNDDGDYAWLAQNSGGTFVPGPEVEGFDYIGDVASKAAHSVADYNNDGLVDLFVFGRQASVINVMINRDGSLFERIDLTEAFDVLPTHVGWAGRPTSAPGDLDLDGRIDFVTMETDLSEAHPGTVAVLKNTSEEAGRYVQLEFDASQMGNGGNSGAVGALVEALNTETGVRVGTSYRTVRSYQQMVPDFAHVGTDTHETIDLRVRWPSGFGEETFEDVSTMGRYRITFDPNGSSLAPL